MKSISTHRAPAAIGPYSQAVCKNGIVFISGQIGLDPATGELLPTFEEQVIQTMRNLKNILEEDNIGMGSVMKATVYLIDMEQYPQFNDIYKSFFEDPFPAREVVQICALPKGALVEISMIAME